MRTEIHGRPVQLRRIVAPYLPFVARRLPMVCQGLPLGSRVHPSLNPLVRLSNQSRFGINITPSEKKTYKASAFKLVSNTTFDSSMFSSPRYSQPSSLADIPYETLLSLLQPVTVPSSSPRSTFTNWGLSYSCKPLVVFEPETEEQCEQIFELARREGQTVRAAGVGHSPSDLACTSGYMLRTEKLDKIIEVSLKFRYRILFVVVFPSHHSPCLWQSRGDLRIDCP